jgi:N-acyl amino acid synthase FeeM
MAMVDESSMNLATGGASRSFSDRVLRLLERVEHRVATEPAEREVAFRLRFDAYQKIGFLQRSDGDRLYDPRYDDAPNAWITTTWIDGELAGTVRVNIGADENAVLPGLQVFADVLVPKLSAGQVLAEFTRLAARLSLSSLHPELAYVVMRPAFMAAEHFEADFAVGTPRAEHIAFYRRAFGATLWRPPRDYPGLTAKLACVGADYRLARQFIEQRYPFFKSDPVEREALFGPSKQGSSRGGSEGLGAELVG